MEALPAGPGDQAWLESLARDPAVAPSIAITTDVGAAILAGEMYVLWEAGTRIGGLRLNVRHTLSRIGVINTLMLTPGLRGRGLGTAAVHAAITLGFGESKLHRLEAEVFTTNAPALAAFTRAGFETEGCRRRAYLREGLWKDSVLLAALNEA